LVSDHITDITDTEKEADNFKNLSVLPCQHVQGGSKKVSCCTVSTAYFF